MDNEQLLKEFPQAGDLIYLNHAAVSPWPLRTQQAVSAFASENIHLGGKNYVNWLEKEKTLRKQIQELINAPSLHDIALVKNTSEALSVVASGVNWRTGENIVTSAEEFPSNRMPWQAQSERGVELKEVDIRVDEPEQALMDACDGRTRLLTISSVQYGSGICLDLNRLGEFCKSNDILFCVDAIQSIGARQLDVQEIGADFVMADAHKWMLGPEGLALFYSRPEARDELSLYQYGWHMVEIIDFARREWDIAKSARRFECGSSNMLGIHAMSASLSLFLEYGMDNVEKKLASNVSYLYDALAQIPGLQFLTPADSKKRAGIINFSISGVDMEQLHQKMLKNNTVCVYRGGGLRFSPHFYTPRHKLDKAVDIINANI